MLCKPAPPPPVHLLPQVIAIPHRLSSAILKTAKAALKAVPKVQEKKAEASAVLDSVDKDGQELALEDEIEQAGFSLQPGLSVALVYYQLNMQY